MLSSAFLYLARSRAHPLFSTVTRGPWKFFSASTSGTENLSGVGDPFVSTLITDYDFSESEAVSISKRLNYPKNPARPIEAIEFLRQCGLSDSQIRKNANVSPQLLILKVDSTLKPKVDFLKDVGIIGSDLSRLITKNTAVLTVSLNKKLIPCVEILKKILVNDKDVVKVLTRCRWIFTTDSNVELLPNLKFLEDCGISGSQLANLLKFRPHLFVMPESKLKGLVDRVKEMGLSTKSGMFVHALRTLCSVRADTLAKKFELVKSFGFSEDEIIMLFRRSPVLFIASEKKLKVALEFFLKTVEVDSSFLSTYPTVLLLNLEKRVLPRYKVVSALKSKSLWKRDRSLGPAMLVSEESFLQRYILRVKDVAEELLDIYKGNISVNDSTR